MKRFAALIGAIGISVLMTAPALANSLVATSPIAGATLKVAPSAVTITVEITPMDMGNEITVTDPGGRRVDDGTLTVAENDIIIGMKPITESGAYKVSYNIISEMDVPLVGSFIFNFSIHFDKLRVFFVYFIHLFILSNYGRFRIFITG